MPWPFLCIALLAAKLVRTSLAECRAADCRRRTTDDGVLRADVRDEYAFGGPGDSTGYQWQVAASLERNSTTTIGVDILASPIVFAFAWVYADFGPIIASLAWIPILGLRQLNTINLELAQTNKELLELMVKSIEARDPYTSGHSRRVKEYAIKIAKLMGYVQSDIEKIGTAALLHDVGKIYDKYAPILAKDDRLTPEEWPSLRNTLWTAPILSRR